MSDKSYTPRKKPRPREGNGVACMATRARSEVVAEVCERIASGESVEAIFASKPADYPSLRTFRYWCADDPEVIPRYDRAMYARAIRGAEQIEALADEPPRYIDSFDEDGKKLGSRVDPGWEQYRKTRIETRKWNAARLAAKKYGDRTIISGDPDSPIEHRHAIAGRLLPELAPGDANIAIEGTVTERSGSTGLRVERLLGTNGSTTADRQGVDVLDGDGGAGMGKDSNRS